MRCLAVITMLILALALVQPIVAQSFKPDFKAGHAGWGQKNYATALRHFRPLAKHGDAAAQYSLAAVDKKLRAEGKLPLQSRQAKANPAFTPDLYAGVTAYSKNDFATALRHYRPLAEQGHANAQRRLGQMYLEGYGVTQDYAEAVRWYRKAAMQGVAETQYELGRMSSDRKEAFRWLRKAAEQGHLGAKHYVEIS